MQQNTFPLEDSTATEAFGAALARCCAPGSVIYLYGDLGAGKTTLVRGFLQVLGHQGAVKSPTYTLVEPYQLTGRQVYHFDLYRLGEPEELEYLGIRDYFDGQSLALIEWPQQGSGVLPVPTLALHLAYTQTGRKVTLKPGAEGGAALLECVTTHFSRG